MNVDVFVCFACQKFSGQRTRIVKRSFSNNNCIFLLIQKDLSLNKFLTNKFQKEIKIKVMLMIILIFKLFVDN